MLASCAAGVPVDIQVNSTARQIRRNGYFLGDSGLRTSLSHAAAHFHFTLITRAKTQFTSEKFR